MTADFWKRYDHRAEAEQAVAEKKRARRRRKRSHDPRAPPHGCPECRVADVRAAGVPAHRRGAVRGVATMSTGDPEELPPGRGYQPEPYARLRLMWNELR